MMDRLPNLGPYPQTIEQLSEWSERVTQLDANECAVLLHKLGQHAAVVRRG